MKQKRQTRSSPDGLEGAEVPEAAAAEPTERTVEDWREAKGTPAWQWAAAKTMHRWPIGRVLTESAYDDAIEAAAHVPISSPTLPTSRKRKVS